MLNVFGKKNALCVSGELLSSQKKKTDMLWEWRTSNDDFSIKDDTRHPMQTIYSVSVDMLIFYKHLYNFQTH